MPLPEVLADGSDAQVPGTEVGAERKGGPTCPGAAALLQVWPLLAGVCRGLEGQGEPQEEECRERLGLPTQLPQRLQVVGDLQLGAGGMPSFSVPLCPIWGPKDFSCRLPDFVPLAAIPGSRVLPGCRAPGPAADPTGTMGAQRAFLSSVPSSVLNRERNGHRWDAPPQTVHRV